MITRLRFSHRITRGYRLRSAMLFVMVLVCSTALAEPQDIILKPCNNIDTTFAAQPGQAVNAVPTVGPKDIEVTASGNIFWALAPGAGCSGGPTVFTCAGMTVTIPDPAVAQPNTTKVTITGTASGTQGASGKFTLTVTDAANLGVTCDGKYELHTTADGGGWGDPHLTNVDGTHWDFQSAGEFTALRQQGFEVQTRQTPVPSASIPLANEYTGLSSCVAIYTAAAARIGSNRVSLLPNLSGQPDPSGMQLRVNGQLVTLTERGIDLLSEAGKGPIREGRIVPAAGGAIVISDRRGTQLVLEPNFWASQQKWYLNVNIYQTSATQGVMGRRAEGSWLPALPDGTSLGPRPDGAQERYQALYETFADAWRVTDATSLFDYAPGTNTATFTLDEWPRFNAQSCGIQGQTSVQPATQAAAEAACAAVTNPAQKADCVFDVMVTGETSFAASYVSMQRFQPHGSGWQPVLGSVGGGPGQAPGAWPWWWWILLLILLLIILFLWLRRNATP